ncbi:MAG: hypothetical protein HYV92_10050 [Candidatus Rokubacteria bacterium]|nr:hypothetical protein [Candidatus Rokubacteria bacterium]MBI2544598.1 hypothetical protein [Candidatus Rokubacteria bacterium]MBI2554736.1 hypothetical protein [Candidatus Rokubacteria bacterium]
MSLDDRLHVGARGGVYRRDGATWKALGDNGKRWWRLGLTLPSGTPEPHTPRVTAILFVGGDQ